MENIMYTPNKPKPKSNMPKWLNELKRKQVGYGSNHTIGSMNFLDPDFTSDTFGVGSTINPVNGELGANVGYGNDMLSAFAQYANSVEGGGGSQAGVTMDGNTLFAGLRDDGSKSVGVSSQGQFGPVSVGGNAVALGKGNYTGGANASANLGDLGVLSSAISGHNSTGFGNPTVDWSKVIGDHRVGASYSDNRTPYNRAPAIGASYAYNMPNGGTIEASANRGFDRDKRGVGNKFNIEWNQSF